MKFGDSDKLRLGEWVIAIGNPFGLGGIGHRRHRLGAQPRHQFRSLRQLTSRPTPRSIAAIPAGRCSTWTARSSASTPRSSRRPAARSASASRCPAEDRDRRHRPAAPVRRDAPRLARRAHPAGHRRHRREPRLEADARRAGRRRRRQGPGQAGRHRARRRDRQVRRQGHQGDARSAAHRRRHAGRQGRRGHRHPQGQGRDEDRQARPARGRREAAAGIGQDRDAAGQGQDRRQEGARPRPRHITDDLRSATRSRRSRASSSPASIPTRRPPTSACRPAT